MEKLLKIENLKKRYFRKNALNGIHLELEKGKILGLLGPNGSGKTTLMKIMAGILRETSGEVLIDGQRPSVATKAKVAFLPDVSYLYKWMKVKDAINYFSDFYLDFDKEKAYELLQFMNLEAEQKVNTLSKGMMEKLNLTLVFSRKAKLYILDEPLGGIDPTTREKIMDTIINSYSEDSSMIISTHLVNDIERLFDEVAFISNGDIVLQGNAEELRIEKGKSIDGIYREVFQ